MTDLSPVQELLALIGKQIAEEEIKVRERVGRLSHDPELGDEIREEWHKYHLRIQPLLDQREYIIKQLVTIEAAKPPVPILVSRT
jgi:hypothetical protein